MLIEINDLLKKLNFEIKGIIHIGAGSGAELRNYSKLKVQNFLMIEPDPESYRKLILRKYYYKLIYQKKINTENCLITDRVKKNFPFNIMNVKDCNSILELHLHKKFYPEIYFKKTLKIKSQTLNSLFHKKYKIKNYNFINIDIQGAELIAFKGAEKILKNIDGIYTEVNFKKLYKNCALISEIDKFLKKFGFKRVLTTRLHNSWGDALYIK